MTDSGRPRGRTTWETIDIDHTVAHASRVYDYLLGGTDNFEADRIATEHMTAVLPGGIDGARANARTNRIFLGQAVRWLAGEHGVRQFLDIGPGIPTRQQTHEVAQDVAPESRIVYVDNDPIVLAHAHELLKSTPQGHVEFFQEDLRNPEAIVERAAETLDFASPVALMVVAIYHMIPGDDDPYRTHEILFDGLPSGSWVVLSHLTADFMADEMTESVRRLSEGTREQFTNRTREEFTRFTAGLDLVDPGVAQINEWLSKGPVPPPAGIEPKLPEGIDPDWVNPLWAAVGRKP
jgi:hypothetical protein